VRTAPSYMLCSPLSISDVRLNLTTHGVSNFIRRLELYFTLVTSLDVHAGSERVNAANEASSTSCLAPSLAFTDPWPYFHIITMEILLLLYLFWKCPDNFSIWLHGLQHFRLSMHRDTKSPKARMKHLTWHDTVCPSATPGSDERSLDKDASDWRTLGSNQPQR